jgi:hypothetical protein
MVTASFPSCLTEGVHPIIGVNLRLSAAELISFPNTPEFDDPFS